MHLSVRIGGVLGAVLLLGGCGSLLDSDRSGYICTAHLEPGIEVEIRDAVSGAALAYGARGAVRDGAYIDSLTPAASSSSDVRDLYSRVAAHERPGTYSVEVVHPGYEPWSVSGVRVESGICHVEQVDLRADLIPLS